MPPESLYVHVPFCERKCNYCAFESAVPRPGERETYLDALEQETALRLKNSPRPVLRTCYIGGGTPTTLGASHWDALISLIERHFDFAEDAEVTVEANPNSLTADHLHIWRDWRVTRVSVGVQSFDDAELALMGRLHSAKEAHCALSAALASGFDVSADLIFGLPHQTLANWARTLKEASRCGLGHISLYQLTLEEGTPWEDLDEKTLGDGYAAYRFAQWYLQRKGFEQYEVANFAKKGKESRHNINYWQEGEYIGIGPAAASYENGARSKNHGTLRRYARSLSNGELPVEESERLSPERSAREAAILALRMTRGIDAEDFKKRYGTASYKEIAAIIEEFPPALREIDEKGIRLTKSGMRVANRIWAEIV